MRCRDGFTPPSISGAVLQKGVANNVHLVPPISVKPFVKRQRNNAADAASNRADCPTTEHALFSPMMTGEKRFDIIYASINDS